MPEPIQCAHCERTTCLPPDYAPLCSKHYMLSIAEATKQARLRFKAKIKALAESKGLDPKPFLESIDHA